VASRMGGGVQHRVRRIPEYELRQGNQAIGEIKVPSFPRPDMSPMLVPLAGGIGTGGQT
jgi:hypothetical protein